MIEPILQRLDKVKGRNGNYTACCPAHDDKGPSLAIKEEDGKVLLHCFAGCSVESVVGALGMEMTDLFPPKVSYERQPRTKFFASDLLRVIKSETDFVMVCAYHLSRGKKLSQVDLERLKKAHERIDTAMEASGAYHH